ncbi:hypothetical protein P152DRAFT_16623 [Eremomyces bilateralis CBS 781.70]|uniref:Uncharacterized protein n=1 Tax=Eremomyces bilateralis CBS 781.70 TaxID=1392243 RepID=A0A6G1GHL1_9PEZI|nr:uncharacterized protein P152DRAFT_16623 [Eremomyces bilateralis CBS 781.70]KAF1817359.1 hypothetical protein P152DRAFT_16623 [Eremomyces bilateralis CBS 781.70]
MMMMLMMSDEHRKQDEKSNQGTNAGKLKLTNNETGVSGIIRSPVKPSHTSKRIQVSHEHHPEYVSSFTSHPGPSALFPPPPTHRSHASTPQASVREPSKSHHHQPHRHQSPDRSHSSHSPASASHRHRHPRCRAASRCAAIGGDGTSVVSDRGGDGRVRSFVRGGGSRYHISCCSTMILKFLCFSFCSCGSVLLVMCVL